MISEAGECLSGESEWKFSTCDRGAHVRINGKARSHNPSDQDIGWALVSMIFKKLLFFHAWASFSFVPNLLCVV